MTSTFDREMKDPEFKEKFEQSYKEFCKREDSTMFTLVDLGIQEEEKGLRLYFSKRLSAFIDTNKDILKGVSQVVKSCKQEGKEITETRQQILDFLNLEFNKE